MTLEDQFKALVQFNLDGIVRSQKHPIFVIPAGRKLVISKTYGFRTKACAGLDPGSGMTLEGLFTSPSILRNRLPVSGYSKLLKNMIWLARPGPLKFNLIAPAGYSLVVWFLAGFINYLSFALMKNRD